MNTFICYPKCSTCKKAEKYLKDNCVEYELRDIKLNNPSKKELDSFISSPVTILLFHTTLFL